MNGRSSRGGTRRKRALRHGASACGVLALAVAAACYSTGDGTAPPPETFYFPVGLAVSAAGNVLYAANSDFDLQWNGGTVQSYDLNAIRNDTARLLLGAYAGNPFLPAGSGDAGAPLPWASGYPSTAPCPDTTINPPPTDPNNPGGRLPIGEACAPPMSSQAYWRDSVVIGAFATDIQLSTTGSRLFVPVRGDATLTWMDVANDLLPTPSGASYAAGASANDTASTYYPFFLDCGRDTTGRCDAAHHAGTLNDPGNTRQVSMPGEPFGMAQSDDGTAIAITHQTQTETSLFLTGVVPGAGTSFDDFDPSIQYVLQGVPLGGIGIVSIPHDLAAVPNDPANPLRPAFLQSNDSTAQIDLLRYYTDEGYQGLFDGGAAVDAGAAVAVGSSNLRPFLIDEQTFEVSVNSSGTNSRGMAIDPTPRRACELALPAGTPTTDPAYIACAQLPARVFIANRSPASLIYGQIGAPNGNDGTYNPDALSLSGNVPLTAGPSNVYLAPIVDQSGH
jgi:hypothetical protein